MIHRIRDLQSQKGHCVRVQHCQFMKGDCPFKGGRGVGGKYQAVVFYSKYMEQIETIPNKTSIAKKLYMIFPQTLQLNTQSNLHLSQ